MARHPLTRPAPKRMVDKLRIDADFVAQFTDDARRVN
jgi:hypothetical protein